jgi:hypothetical protein
MALSLARKFVDKSKKKEKAGGFHHCYSEASGVCQGVVFLRGSEDCRTYYLARWHSPLKKIKKKKKKEKKSVRKKNKTKEKEKGHAMPKGLRV